MGLQRVSALQNSPAPLGPNVFDACSAGSSIFGCSALIDIGIFSIALPPQLIPSLLLLLGLPPSPPLVGTIITGRTLISDNGYTQITCDARGRPGPTIDFQIQVCSACPCTSACAKDLTSPWSCSQACASLCDCIQHPHYRLPLQTGKARPTACWCIMELGLK